MFVMSRVMTLVVAVRVARVWRLSRTWRVSMVMVSREVLLGTMQLWFRTVVWVPVVCSNRRSVWGDVFSCRSLELWAVEMTEIMQLPTVRRMHMLDMTVCVEWTFLVAAIGLSMLSGPVVLRRLSRLTLDVPAGQFTETYVTNWLCRVLGRGQAFRTLTGPRAVNITNGLGSARAALLIEIWRLLTVLSSVDRAPGDVWPTLLLTIMPVNMLFGPNLKLWARGPNIEILATLSGSRLVANRTC